MAVAVNAQVSYAFCVIVAVLAMLTAVEGRSAVAERVAAPTGSAGRLNVIDEGPRSSTLTPVLFVHSFAGSAEQWDAQIAHLRSTRRVVAIDLRGHGKSDAPANAAGYNVAALASDIGALADQFGFKRFILVGHGVGAVAALAYAERNPLRVDRLVLVGTPGRTPRVESERIMDSMRSDHDMLSHQLWRSLLDGARPETEALVQQAMKRMPRDTALSLMQAVFEYDPVRALRSYPGPKLLIDTEHANAKRSLYRQAPDVPRRLIAGTSHWPHLDTAAEFNRVLDAFL